MNINKDFEKVFTKEEWTDFFADPIPQLNPKYKYFKTQFPLEEAISRSNLAYLKQVDDEYTKIAQEKGEAYYKWDTNKTIVKIYNDMTEMGEWAKIAEFVSMWLTLTLKFEDLDDKFMYLFNEFLEGRYHYKDEYLGKEVYKIIESRKVGYIYSLFAEYLENKDLLLPPYIRKLTSWCWQQKSFKINHTLPNEDGSELITATNEEISKYMGRWHSEEDLAESDRKLRKLIEEYEKNGLI